MRGVYRGRGDRWPLQASRAAAGLLAAEWESAGPLGSNASNLSGFAQPPPSPPPRHEARIYIYIYMQVGFKISSGGWSCQPSGQVRATPTRQLGGVVAMTTDLVDRDETTTSPRSGNRDALEKAARLSCVHVAS